MTNVSILKKAVKQSDINPLCDFNFNSTESVEIWYAQRKDSS